MTELALGMTLVLLLACAMSHLTVQDVSAVMNLTKRDFGWLGWKPTHVHYKGGLYEESTRAIATDPIEDGEAVVVYVHESGATYVRPARMFDEVSRFTPIEDGDSDLLK